MLFAKPKVIIADAIVEYEGCEEVPFEVEGITFSLGEEEGVMTFTFECRVFLGVEGVSSVKTGSMSSFVDGLTRWCLPSLHSNAGFLSWSQVEVCPAVVSFVGCGA